MAFGQSLYNKVALLFISGVVSVRRLRQLLTIWRIAQKCDRANGSPVSCDTREVTSALPILFPQKCVLVYQLILKDH